MKLLKSLLSVALLFPAIAFAGSGKGISPHWSSFSSNSPTYLFVSNITDNYINVDIKFVNKDGNTITPSTYSNFVSGNTQLAPGKSGYVTVYTSAFDYGFATIEWSNVEGDDDTVALISHGYQLIVETSRRTNFAIQVNDGKPF